MIKSHEAIVHFPIALFISAFLFGIIGLFYKRAIFKEIILWNIIFGIVGSGVAIYTGIEEQQKITDPVLKEVLAMHERNAYFVCIMLFILTIWMGWRKKEMETMEYMAWMSIFFIAATSVGYQGFIGHEMRSKQIEKTIEMSVSKPKFEEPPMDYGWNF